MPARTRKTHIKISIYFPGNRTKLNLNKSLKEGKKTQQWTPSNCCGPVTSAENSQHACFPSLLTRNNVTRCNQRLFKWGLLEANRSRHIMGQFCFLCTLKACRTAKKILENAWNAGSGPGYIFLLKAGLTTKRLSSLLHLKTQPKPED